MKAFRERILNLLVMCLKGLHGLTSEIKLPCFDGLSCSEKKNQKQTIVVVSIEKLNKLKQNFKFFFLKLYKCIKRNYDRCHE